MYSELWKRKLVKISNNYVVYFENSTLATLSPGLKRITHDPRISLAFRRVKIVNKDVVLIVHSKLKISLVLKCVKTNLKTGRIDDTGCLKTSKKQQIDEY